VTETSKFGVIANEIGVRPAGFQSEAKSGDASLDSAIRMNLKTIAPVPAIVRRSDMALSGLCSDSLFKKDTSRLRGAMNDKVGIWIDHKRAVIVSTSADRVTTKTLESEVGPHARYSDRAEYPTSDGPQDGRGEKKYEERYGQHLDRYYDEVISQLGQPEALLIFGPGEAKLQLKERLSRSKALSKHIVGIETTDKLTDPQIVAKVKEHFGIDR
jgi:hypothetical protein